MTEVLKSRISDELLSLIGENLGLYQSLLDVRKKHDLELGLMLTDPNARSETRRLDNGDLEVLLTFPLDNNYDREDGRLWVIDRFVFDGKDKTFRKFTYQRDVEYNNLGANKVQWRQWRDLLHKEATVSNEAAIEFAKNAIHSYSRPVLTPHLKALAEAHQAETQAAEKGDENYSAYLAPLHVGVWEKSNLQVKFSDPRNHITRVERDKAYDIIFSYVVEDNDPETQGHLWVQDKFTYFESDVPIHSSRKITVAYGSPQNEGWEAARRLFYGPDGKTLSSDMVLPIAAAQKYMTFFPKGAFEKTPDFAEIAKKDASGQSQEPKVELTLAQFESAFDKTFEKKSARNVEAYEPEMAQALQGNVPYFETLKRSLAPHFQWDWESFQIKTKVEVQGDKTKVKFIYLFADSSLDGVDRGRLVYTETVNFTGKEIAGIDRVVHREGADPEGKIEKAMAQIQSSLGDAKFPTTDDPVTQSWIKGVIPMVAPHLMERPGQKPLLEIADAGLSEEKSQSLRALKEIQDKLTPFLYQPGIDPKFRVRYLRALSAFQYDDVNSAFKDLTAIVGGPEGTGQAGAQSAQNPDQILMSNIMSALYSGLTDEAIKQTEGFKSPRIKEIFDATLQPILRKQLNAEGLTLMSKMVANKIQLQEHAATKWIGGEDFDGKAATILAEGLFAKAQKRAETYPDANPFAVLRDLSDLNESELKLRDKILKDPIFKAANSIAEETDQEIQAKDYFNFARSDLMEAKLGGAAAYLAQFVAIKKMPLTASLAGLEVIEKFSGDEFKTKLAEKFQAQVGEKEKWLQLLTDPVAMSKLSEAEAQSLQENIFKTYGEKMQQTQKQLVAENPQYAALLMTVAAGEQLFEQAFQVMAAQPDQSIEAILNGLKITDEAQLQVKAGILNDPRAKKIFAANQLPTVAERHQAYGKILTEFSQNPEMAPQVAELVEFMQQSGFPEQAGAEGALLLSHFFLSGPRQNMMAVNMALLAQVMEPDILVERQAAMKAVQADGGMEQAAHRELMEKARFLAASRPHDDPIEIIRSITDASLDAEIQELKEKWSEPTAEQTATLENLERLYGAIKKVREDILQSPTLKEVGAFAKIQNPFERREAYDKFFTRIKSNSGLVAQVVMLGQIQDSAKRKELAETLAKTEGLSETTKKNILIMGETEDRQVFSTAMETLSQAPEFAEVKYLESVQQLGSRLAMGQLVTATPHEAVRFAPGVEKADQEKQLAQMGPEDTTGKDLVKFLAFSEGRADLGTKLEYMSPVIMEELTKPTTLAAMALAGYLGPVAESMGLGLVGRAGLSGKTLIWSNRLMVAGGVVAEGAVFTTAMKVGESSFYGSAHQWDHYFRDVGASVLTFGALRVGHAGAGMLSQKLLATGRLGKWAGGPVKAGELSTTLSPAGRIRVGAPLANGSVPTLTKAGQRVSGIFNHSAGIGSMYGSHYLAQMAGLAQKNPQGWEGQMADTIIMYIQAMAMFGMINSATGGRYQQRIADLKFGNQLKLDTARLKTGKVGKGVPQLVDAATVEMAKQGLDLVKEGVLYQKRTLSEGKKEFNEAEFRKVLQEELGFSQVESIEFRRNGETLEIRDNRSVVVEGHELFVGDKALKTETWTPISEKNALSTEILVQSNTPFTPPDYIPLLEKLAKLPKEEQLTLSRKLDGAKDFGNLMKSLDKVSGEGGPILARWIGESMSGNRSLDSLPNALNLRSNVERLMVQEVSEFHHQGLIRERFLLKDLPEGSELHGVQKEYFIGTLAKGLMRRLAVSPSKEEVLSVLAKSPFKEIDGLSIEAWIEGVAKGELESGALGLRQRLRDLSSESKVDPNEGHVLQQLVKRHIDLRQAESYEQAQRILRTKIDQMSPEIKVLFLKGHLQGPRAKRQQALLNAYFGPLGSREMASAGQGFEIATLFGRAGLTESMTLVETTNTRGRPEWYLVRGEATEGWPLVKTGAKKSGEKSTVADVFHSPEALLEMVPEAKQRLATPSAIRTMKTDPNEIRTLVMHPWGASEYIFKANAEGKLNLEIRYSFRAGHGGKTEAANAHLKKIRDLPWEAQGVNELNITHVKKFSEFLQGLEYRNGLPSFWQTVSGSVPSTFIKPRWAKMPEISLKRFRKSEKVDPKEDKETTTKPKPKSKAKPKSKPKAKAAEEPAEKVEPAESKGPESAEPVTEKKPPVDPTSEAAAPQKTAQKPVKHKRTLPLPRPKPKEPKAEAEAKKQKPEAEEEIQDLETKDIDFLIDDALANARPATPKRPSLEAGSDPNISRIKQEAASRVQEGLRQKYGEKEMAGVEFIHGDLVRFSINAGEATMKPSHMDRVASVEFEYNGLLKTIKLTEKSARDIENARSHNTDPEIDAFYEGILTYQHVGLVVGEMGF